eukprot:8829668-Pyramimonas_sp.AAC.1
MAHVLNTARGTHGGSHGGGFDDAKMRKFLGSKSTFRLLNRKYTNQTLNHGFVCFADAEPWIRLLRRR